MLAPSRCRAASAVNPPGNTDNARIAAWPAGSRRFQLQSITASSVRWRCGASLALPRSTANRSSKRRAISATDMTRTLAAASSAASGSPSKPAAQLPHGIRGQVGVGPDRPGPLPEQLGRRGQVQLGQQVHRFRREAERSAAGREHPQFPGQ